MNYSLQMSPSRQEVEKQFLSVMFALGSNSESINLGSNHSNSDRAWVDNQSSIVGTDSVDIDVKGKLGMDGSLIANIDKNGKDQGNLDIKAGSIETSDINNYDRNSESGYNINTNLGSNPQGTNDGYDSGKSHLTITDKGSEKEGITHSTIGQGNIEIADGSDISGINRDINKTETITKDQVTGALDVDLTVNHSIITGGPEKLLYDIQNYTNNLYGASDKLALLGVNATGAGLGITGIILNPFTGKIEVTDDAIRFIGNSLGLSGTAITLGNTQNYFGDSDPNRIERPYYAPYQMPLGYHEDEHIPQWNKDGAFKFISNYLHEGLPWYGNTYDQEANKNAIERMRNEGIFFDIQKLPLYSLYTKGKNNENK